MSIADGRRAVVTVIGSSQHADQISPAGIPGCGMVVNMPSPMVGVRVPESLETAARARSPELASLTPSELLRVALAMLAGHGLGEAIALAHGQRGVPLSEPSDSRG